MFKKLEEKWNSKTPKILHNRSKENFIFQLSLVGVFLLGMHVKDWWYWRQFDKKNASSQI